MKVKNDHRSIFYLYIFFFTGIVEVTGLNPVEALIFFRLILSNCLNWKIYCDDHSSLSILIHPWPHIHVKNPLSKKLNTRLRIYKVFGCIVIQI